MSTSIHEDFSRSHGTKGFSDRSLGLTFSAFFAVVAILPWLRHRSFQWRSQIVSAVFLLVALIAPGLLHPLSRLWLRLSLLLHKIVSPVVTSLIFYLVFVPAAFILWLLGKDPLHRKIEPIAETYWIPRTPPGPAPQTMRNQF